MFSLFPLQAKSYEDYPDYVDTHHQEVRINRKRPNEKQVGRFTIIDDIEPIKSYEEYPDYINEHGQEVRINRKRPNERQVGRFTIVDYIGGSSDSEPKIIGKISKHINLYPNKKVGRFTIKSVVISPSKSRQSKRRSRSPCRRSTSPRIKLSTLRMKFPKRTSFSGSPKKIGRFTLTKKR